MNRVAKFSKVSFDQFYNDYCDTFFEDCDKPSKESVREIYDQIKIPTRATKGSAGYDFFAPFDMSLTPGVFVLKLTMAGGWPVCQRAALDLSTVSSSTIQLG